MIEAGFILYYAAIIAIAARVTVDVVKLIVGVFQC